MTSIQSAAVRWVAAELVAKELPVLEGRPFVTGWVECPHCAFRLHGVQEVADYDGTNWGTAYVCVRCGATHLLGDATGNL